MDRSGTPLLDIRNLQTFFHTDEGVVKSVNGVSYDAYPGETVGVVGESGCGKSVTALSVMRLIPMPPGEIAGGEILFDGEDLVQVEESRMRQIRGGKIGMIFQEPMTSLNPVFTVGNQIEEAVKLHLDLSPKDSRARAIEMLDKVGIPSPEARVDEYPHQLSGGMRQRVMIAMALSCNPRLLIADEPTTALDVTIQAQILDLMRSLQDELGMGVLMITHDLGVIAETAHRVVVMYAEQDRREGHGHRSCSRTRATPTRAACSTAFRPSRAATTGSRRSRAPVPNPLEFPVGCKFHNRCPFAEEHCVSNEPPLLEIEEGALRGVLAARSGWPDVRSRQGAGVSEATINESPAGGTSSGRHVQAAAGRTSQEVLSDPEGAASRASSATSRPSTTSASTSTRARRSVSWASRAAARRPSAVRSSG